MTHLIAVERRALALLLMTIGACSTAGCTNEGASGPDPVLFNFYAIEEGKAFRSSQLSGEALGWVIDRHAIKTVVNLRGPNPGKPWYDQEVAACRDKNVALVDIPMSSQSLPSADLLEQIQQTLRTAEYPILIHCESGSDRSGAVSGLYRLDVLGQDRARALGELSTKYWHFRERKPCMSKLVEIYEPTEEWLARYRAEHDTLECR